MSTKKRMRLGIYGGTFDPVHLGHLILAREALEQLKLEAVLFVPARRSPFKSRAPFDTAAEIREAFPRAKLLWLIGADQLPDLRQWHRARDLRQLVTFALLPRSGEAPRRLPAGVLGLPRPRRVDISATEIRHRVKSHLPIDHVVPAPVAAYIARHRLYLA
jgi:nicotinate-nucleotide adenylyltransferase